MNDYSAHILRTDPNWFYFLKSINATGEVNFWRKDTKSITNINKNDRIYFLRKKTKQYPKIALIGMGLFQRYEILSPNDAWINFKKNNGCNNLNELISKFPSTISQKIGCLILKNIIFFEYPIFLSDVNISFSPKIQSRKSISNLEEVNILNLLNGYELIDSSFFHDKNKKGKDVKRLRNERVNQTYFRNSLIRIYNKCVICGLNNKKLLRASHSKPWTLSNATEKVDPMNGLLLCANHDILYDKHLISFDENKKIIISPNITNSELPLLNMHENLYINVPDEAMKYIAYHRKKFLEQNLNLHKKER